MVSRIGDTVSGAVRWGGLNRGESRRSVPVALFLSSESLSSTPLKRRSARSTSGKMSSPPCLESSIPLCILWKSDVPSCVSSCLTACETAGWEMKSSSAALVRLPHRATV